MPYKNKADVRARTIRYRAAHPGQRKVDDARYREKHRDDIHARYQRDREVVLAQCKVYRDANRETRNAQNRRYWADNSDDIAARRRGSYLLDPAKYVARVSSFRRTHPAYRFLEKAQRRARRASAPRNDFSRAQWREMLLVFDHRCAYCHRHLKQLTQDHLTPFALGGSHTLWNIVPACRSCNSKKGLGPPLIPVQPLLLTLAPPKKARRKILRGPSIPPRYSTWSLKAQVVGKGGWLVEPIPSVSARHIKPLVQVTIKLLLSFPIRPLNRQE